MLKALDPVFSLEGGKLKFVKDRGFAKIKKNKNAKILYKIYILSAPTLISPLTPKNILDIEIKRIKDKSI